MSAYLINIIEEAKPLPFHSPCTHESILEESHYNNCMFKDINGLFVNERVHLIHLLALICMLNFFLPLNIKFPRSATVLDVY